MKRATRSLRASMIVRCCCISPSTDLYRSCVRPHVHMSCLCALALERKRSWWLYVGAKIVPFCGFTARRKGATVGVGLLMLNRVSVSRLLEVAFSLCSGATGGTSMAEDPFSNQAISHPCSYSHSSNKFLLFDI